MTDTDTPTDAPNETPAVEPADPPAATDPDVLAMDDALERGDHVEARALAARLAVSDDPATRDAGLAMLARLKPDTGIVVVLAATGLLILALALGYLGPRTYGGH
ncbi:MAG: hypothetical protein R3A52_10795 [Polyangiales bacterium]